MEELLVEEPDPEEPGHHQVTGILLGRKLKNERKMSCKMMFYIMCVCTMDTFLSH